LHGNRSVPLWISVVARKLLCTVVDFSSCTKTALYRCGFQ